MWLLLCVGENVLCNSLHISLACDICFAFIRLIWQQIFALQCLLFEPAFTCSKVRMEKTRQYVKSVQKGNFLGSKLTINTP